MGISADIVDILNYLLPGFVAAWVFYGLTSHPKASPFERTVQALIFTVIINALVSCVGWLLIRCADASEMSLGEWNQATRLLLATALALVVGHFVAWASNHNLYFCLLNRMKVTSKTSFVSEWHSAFSQFDCFVVLHLDQSLSNRTLFGWPEEWPEDPKNGHFLIRHAEWWTESEDGESYQRQEASATELFLVPAERVLFVEFVATEEPSTNEAASEREPTTSLLDGQDGVV